MNYHGSVLSKDIPAEELFKFLRKAMMRVQEDRPFRGPDMFKEGDFEYRDSTQGGMNAFIGTEVILSKGREVYMLIYHGGYVG